MKRRRAREYALQILFQIELTGGELNEELLNDFWEGNEEEEEVCEFTYSVVRATLDNLPTIDEKIREYAENWSLERMSVIDRNILRAAASELLCRNDIPSQVVINEAIEISKKYSTTDSASFINGILDRISKSGSSA